MRIRKIGNEWVLIIGGKIVLKSVSLKYVLDMYEVLK